MIGRLFVLAARLAAWFLVAVITVLSLVPPSLRPEPGTQHNLEHFAIFMATGLAFGVGYGRKTGVVMVALVLFAGMIELAQIVIPGRHARLSDFIVDAVAMCVGVAVTSIVVTRIMERTV
jgi:VanZ family protein